MGCKDQQKNKEKESVVLPQAAEVKVEKITEETPKKYVWTEKDLHIEIKYYNPDYENNGQFEIDQGKVYVVSLNACKIKSVEFLKHVQPMVLDISGTEVMDLTAAQGGQLVELYMEGTKMKEVDELKGLKLQKFYAGHGQLEKLDGLTGMPLKELNLVSTQVEDLTPLASLTQLQMLWLTGTKVKSIEALKSCGSLISLTLKRTLVEDLSPLIGLRLERLHIAETGVHDLRMITSLPLTRLVFTPDQIKLGIEEVKLMPLKEVGTKFDDEGKDLTSAENFWKNRK
jgi:hypothetical protein